MREKAKVNSTCYYVCLKKETQLCSEIKNNRWKNWNPQYFRLLLLLFMHQTWSSTRRQTKRMKIHSRVFVAKIKKKIFYLTHAHSQVYLSQCIKTIVHVYVCVLLRSLFSACYCCFISRRVSFILPAQLNTTMKIDTFVLFKFDLQTSQCTDYNSLPCSFRFFEILYSLSKWYLPLLNSKIKFLSPLNCFFPSFETIKNNVNR